MWTDGPLNPWELPPAVTPQRVRGGGVHVRQHPVLSEEGDEDGFDESLFFLLALLAGAVSGYLVAIG